MSFLGNVTNSTSSKQVFPWVFGGAIIGYFATRVVQWVCRDSSEKRRLTNYLFPFFEQSIQVEDLPKPSEVCIDLITIKKIEKDQLEHRVTRVTLAEFLKKVSYHELNNLRHSVGWLKRTNEVWDKVIPNSTYIVCAIEEDEKNVGQYKLVANAFLSGNGRMASILDVAVRPEFQRKKIGTLVMNQMIQHIKSVGENYAAISLFAQDDAKMKFYAKFGFKERKHGMEAWGKELNESKV